MSGHEFSILRRVWVAFAFFLLIAAGTIAQAPAPVITVPNPPNSAAQQAKPYVVLVSLDGFRYDYAAHYGAKNLLALAARGASAPEGMIPSYPSVTFPNHYTIVTGLYPEHHGIVANSFYDPVRKENYVYTSATALDGTWYGGTPLWVLAEKNGMRSANFFWPASEAEIQGKRPSYYLHYDGKVPDAERVEQVLAWLKLPADLRPHFITLYYSEVDAAGHQFGPGSPEVGAAVGHVDAMMGLLVAGINELHLPVDLIVVSDHGMETVQGDWINLDQFADLSNFVTVNDMMYAKTEADAQKAYQSLQGASDKFKVYRRAKLPNELHDNENARSGDPIVVATGPYAIRARTPDPTQPLKKPEVGAHGYDPRTLPNMKAIFFAAGPDIRPGVKLPSFENVDVYPFIAKILGLPIGPIDGNLSVLQAALKGGKNP
jgi:predicted AlkP superfamily pyrophosphatase or phosphodiesterase